MFERLEEGLFSVFAAREAPLLRAFRHGVMLVMPLLLAAALAALFMHVPLPGYQYFMETRFGAGWRTPGQLVYNATIQILALAATFSLSACLMDLHNRKRPGDAPLPSMGILTAFCCLFIMTAPENAPGPEGLTLPWGGIRGLFGALVISFCACRLFLALCGLRRLRTPFYAEGADSVLPHMFDTLLPSLCTMGLFVLFRLGLSLLGVESLNDVLYSLVRALFHNAGQNGEDGFGLGVLYTFLVHLSWFFGIHGSDLLDPVTQQALMNNVQSNSMAMNRHLPPPHLFSKYFFDVYIFMGGAGSTLGLLGAIFLRGKDHGTRRVAALSLLPGIFNINELLLFGLPVVLNPALLVPFLCVPLALLFVSYAAVAAGLAPLPVYQVDWTTPVGISAFVSTASWRGVALQLFNLALAVLLYLPFVGLADRCKLVDRRKAFDSLVGIALGNSKGPGGKYCTDRTGSPGALARSLANDMRRHLGQEEKGRDIRLHYQPRVDLVSKTVPCVEALLRWQHPLYGPIPAALTLAIASDTGLSRTLDNHVLAMAFAQQRAWRNENVRTTVSINITEDQLKDPAFPALLESLLTRYKLPAEAILLEVREHLALDPEARYLPALEAIHAIGVNIAVDDFGKGYQSISHIKRLPVSELQIDRTLIRDIATNKSVQDVIGTIQELCLRLGIKTSAEYVEKQEQLEMLLELNFSVFQGYYFSEPIPAEECRDFLRKFGKI